jgi:transposase InsO family protein/transposase-like protein
MYSYEQRKKAIETYLRTKSVSQTLRELGYPSSKEFYKWLHEYQQNGELHKKRVKPERIYYTEEEKNVAVQFYHNNNGSYQNAVDKLGYPSPSQLRLWVKEAEKWREMACEIPPYMIEYTQEKFIKAALEFCSGERNLVSLGQKYHISPNTIKKAAAVLLSKEYERKMSKHGNKKDPTYDAMYESIEQLRTEHAKLVEERAKLQKEVQKLQMERDALEVAGIMLKKFGGINLKMMSNHEKAIVIDALKEKYRLGDLFEMLNISKSSYYYQHHAISQPDRDDAFKACIKQAFFENHKEYGYRRIHAILSEMGIRISEKRVRRIMKQEELTVYRKKGKKYSSYAGEITPAVPNLLERDFHAEQPNEKWLTDITEFSIPAGKVYLSPVIDCFDGMPVSWVIGTSPDAEMVNSMLDNAVLSLKKDEHPIVHSDRGSHYRWPGWIERMEKYHLTRSMSKKGCSPDNSACEGFFGVVKNAIFYGRDWEGVSIDEFIIFLDNYLHWFREKRIKQKLGYKSPIQYRASIGLPFLSIRALIC